MAQDVIRETRVIRDDSSNANDEVRPTTFAARLVNLAGSMLLALLAFRFALMLLGANRGNAIVDFIYGLSNPFVAPFFGIFGYTPQYGAARFEIETLVAMVVYGFLTWLVAYMITINQRRVD